MPATPLAKLTYKFEVRELAADVDEIVVVIVIDVVALSLPEDVVLGATDVSTEDVVFVTAVGWAEVVAGDEVALHELKRQHIPHFFRIVQA